MSNTNRPPENAPSDPDAQDGGSPSSSDLGEAPTSEVPTVTDPNAETAPAGSADAAAKAADPLAEARAEAQRNKESWMRAAADFDNFRKRTRRDLEDARKGGREELLKELLPVFDNLERAIQSAQRAPDVKAVVDGLNMITKQFHDVLGRVGIMKVKTIGSAFDPQVHEAIQQVESADHPPGTIVAEVQPGYVQGERLVRAAMVVVAKPKVGEAADNGHSSPK